MIYLCFETRVDSFVRDSLVIGAGVLSFGASTTRYPVVGSFPVGGYSCYMLNTVYPDNIVVWMGHGNTSGPMAFQGAAGAQRFVALVQQIVPPGTVVRHIVFLSCRVAPWTGAYLREFVGLNPNVFVSASVNTVMRNGLEKGMADLFQNPFAHVLDICFNLQGGQLPDPWYDLRHVPTVSSELLGSQGRRNKSDYYINVFAEEVERLSDQRYRASVLVSETAAGLDAKYTVVCGALEPTRLADLEQRSCLRWQSCGYSLALWNNPAGDAIRLKRLIRIYRVLLHRSRQGTLNEVFSSLPQLRPPRPGGRLRP